MQKFIDSNRVVNKNILQSHCKNNNGRCRTSSFYACPIQYTPYLCVLCQHSLHLCNVETNSNNQPRIKNESTSTPPPLLQHTQTPKRLKGAHHNVWIKLVITIIISTEDAFAIFSTSSNNGSDVPSNKKWPFDSGSYLIDFNSHRFSSYS